jgi:hypothetical protein
VNKSPGIRVRRGYAKARELASLARRLCSPLHNFPKRNLLSKTPHSHKPQQHLIPFSHDPKTIAIMGFLDLVSDAGLTLLNNWVKTRSYIVG